MNYVSGFGRVNNYWGSIVILVISSSKLFPIASVAFSLDPQRSVQQYEMSELTNQNGVFN